MFISCPFSSKMELVCIWGMCFDSPTRSHMKSQLSSCFLSLNSWVFPSLPLTPAQQAWRRDGWAVMSARTSCSLLRQADDPRRCWAAENWLHRSVPCPELLYITTWCFGQDRVGKKYHFQRLSVTKRCWPKEKSLLKLKRSLAEDVKKLSSFEILKLITYLISKSC